MMRRNGFFDTGEYASNAKPINQVRMDKTTQPQLPGRKIVSLSGLVSHFAY
jgi:hypothetical protein